jgi:hypothetical protein
VANWESISAKKRKQVQRDNQVENKHRQDHDYAVGDWVLIRCDGTDGDIVPKLSQPTLGPYRIIQVFTNGTVKIQRHGYQERINIWRLIPFHRRGPT